MKTYTLEAKNFNTVELFYDEITRVLSFPEYFGRNLDALYDVLSDRDEPCVLIWQESAQSKIDFEVDATQPGFYGQVISTLQDVEGLELRLE